jgi:hypothetical protein
VTGDALRHARIAIGAGIEAVVLRHDEQAAGVRGGEIDSHTRRVAEVVRAEPPEDASAVGKGVLILLEKDPLGNAEDAGGLRVPDTSLAGETKEINSRKRPF